MKIEQLDCKWSRDFFMPRLQKKYQLGDFKDRQKPVIFFGCYGRLLKLSIMGCKNLVVIVWSGSDSQRLHEDTNFVNHCIKNKNRIFHIAHSHWIQTDLKHWGLEYIDRVVLPQDLGRFNYEPEVGNVVYHYGSSDREWYYGTHLMKKLRTKWEAPRSKPKVFITKHLAYNHNELYEIYKRSFLGVRLTEHDNMALSCIELGLMGRKSIFNGNIPCAIPYPGPKYEKYDPETKYRWVFQNESLLPHIERMILEEYQKSPTPDKILAEEMREFVYDDHEWIDTKFYE
jgi:hypothetical protein